MAFPNSLTNPGASSPNYQSAPSSVLALAAPAVVKASGGTIVRMSVLVAGSGVGGVFDCASTAATAATANQVAVVPQTVGVYECGFPCLVGITVVPGPGQSLSISYA